jgi:cellulose synthase operon protein C
MEITPDELSRVLALYNQGQYLQAYALAESIAPLNTWLGTAPRLLAGRLVMNLGAPRLGLALHLRAWRETPTDPEAIYYYARYVLQRRGLLAAWEILRQYENLPDAPPQHQADWFAFRADVLGRLRDFDAAEDWLSRAEKIAPSRPWLYVERCWLFELEDRYLEALAAAQHSLSLHPWYRPGVAAAAHILQLLERDAEALELLQEASQHLESASVVTQLAHLQVELGLYTEAQQSYERFAQLSPLLDKEGVQWLTARRSDLAYFCGDYAKAAEWAKQVGTPFYNQLAERLSNSPDEASRVILPVGFVRQHRMTCAPATLATISRFWAMPADHLSIAEEICYDGTSAYSERRWAQQNGWTVREFTVTWQSAVALIDRGIPFTFTTIEPTSGHLQAVIGYDSRLRMLIMRDPYHRHCVEAWADSLLERYRSTGPRGMAMVPREQASLLDGLDLPDAALYDQLDQLQQALVKHDRVAADTVYQSMSAQAPNHRLTLHGLRCLTAYDADQTGFLAATEQLLELFPSDANLLLNKLSCLQQLARRHERVALLQQLCEQKYSHPVFWQQYAQVLSDDAREYDKAIALSRRAIRFMPTEAGNFYTLANIFWYQRQFPEAFELYRFATCLDDKDQKFAQVYFSAARYFNQAESALLFLDRRFQRFGKRSSQPAQTLYWAYSQVERMREAFAVLETAFELRPDDGELLLYAARAYAGNGKFDRAATLLSEAEDKAPRTSWLRTAADLALCRGELMVALDLWQQVVQVEPLAMDANRSVARLLAETKGYAAALEFLEQACDRFPHSYALHQLWSQWLYDEDLVLAEKVLHHLIEIDPVDAWARRQFALVLGKQRRFDEAFQEADIAYRLYPNSPAYYYVYGELCVWAGKLAEAKDAYREAIRLSVDSEGAISQLLSICDSSVERREALDFIYKELVRQVIFGDGLLAYREQARYVLEAEQLLTKLRAALEARTDLWHAWSAMIRQLGEMARLDEAVELAQQGTARFPLLPRMWLDLSWVCQLRKDREGEIQALQQALQISPNWGTAVRQLSDAYQAVGEFDQSRKLLEDAIARSPLDPYNYGCLAHLLWEMGEQERAIAHLEKAVQLEPGYSWAWTTLRNWSGELQRPEIAVKLARDLTIRRGGEARSWLLLAETLTEPEDLEERLAALDQAIALNPRCLDAYDLKAKLLARVERYEEALTTCHPDAWGEQIPNLLRARAAWVESKRGNLQVAIEQLRAVVAEEPDFYGSWCQLADWYCQMGADAEYLEAADHMVQLAPSDAVAWGYRGEAKLRTGDRTGAKADFHHAIELKPDYGFAGLYLFDEQLADNELDDASQTLTLLRSHIASEFVTARQVQLAVNLGDERTASQGLRDLCLSKSEEYWPISAATKAMCEAGWTSAAEQVLSEALELPDLNPELGAFWVECCVALERWQQCQMRLHTLHQRGKVGQRAIATYVDALAGARQYQRLQRYIQSARQSLHRDTYTWGSVGWALLTSGDFQAAAQWLADWQERSDLKPWMLSNLVEALRYLKRDKESNKVCRYALTLAQDHATYVHRLWLAFDEALAGRSSLAEYQLKQVDSSSLQSYYHFLYLLVQAMLEAQAKSGSHQRRFNQARSQLRQAKITYPTYFKDALMGRAYRRGIWRIAKDCRSLVAVIWAMWRWLLSFMASR